MSEWQDVFKAISMLWKQLKSAVIYGSCVKKPILRNTENIFQKNLFKFLEDVKFHKTTDVEIWWNAEIKL